MTLCYKILLHLPPKQRMIWILALFILAYIFIRLQYSLFLNGHQYDSYATSSLLNFGVLETTIAFNGIWT